MVERDDILKLLHAKVNVNGHIVGAAVGSGMTDVYKRQDYRFFSSSLVIGICGGNYFLWNFFSADYFYCYSYISIWRSCSGMAFFGLYLVFCKWNSIILHRNCRAIFVKDLFGNKTPTSLYFKGVP